MDFHEFVRIWGLILNSPMGYLECFVVKLFVMEKYFELYYLRDLEGFEVVTMNYLSIYCRCLILVLTRMSCSAKILLEGRVDVICWFRGVVGWFA